jgi:hypothetical protein
VVARAHTEDELVVLALRIRAQKYSARTGPAAVGNGQTQNAGVEVQHLVDVGHRDADVTE